MCYQVLKAVKDPFVPHTRMCRHNKNTSIQIAQGLISLSRLNQAKFSVEPFVKNMQQQRDINYASEKEDNIRQLHRPSSLTHRDILKLKFSSIEMANYDSKQEICQFHRVSQMVKQQNPRLTFSTLSLSSRDTNISIVCSRCNSATSFRIDHNGSVKMESSHRCHCKIMRLTPKFDDLTGQTQPTKYDCRKAAIRFAILKLKLPIVAYQTHLPDWAGPPKPLGFSRDHLKLANGKWFSYDMKRLDNCNHTTIWQVQDFPKTKKEAQTRAWGRKFKKRVNP